LRQRIQRHHAAGEGHPARVHESSGGAFSSSIS
jgi:hypothetical protein